MKEVQLEIYEQVLKPKSNVNTRWFSNIDVMKRMLEIKPAAEGVIEALSLQFDERLRASFIKDNTFDENETEMMEYIVDIMDKLQNMSETMSSDTFPSLSLLIPDKQTPLDGRFANSRGFCFCEFLFGRFSANFQTIAMFNNPGRRRGRIRRDFVDTIPARAAGESSCDMAAC